MRWRNILERILIAKALENGYPKELMLLVRNGFVVKRFNYVDEKICREYECINLLSEGLLLPGLIDLHVHLRGLELSYKEDEESGTKAAAHGGLTVVVDMPNTVPKIDNVFALKKKLEELKAKSYVDYGVYVSPPSNKDELLNMLLMEGVVGTKIFPQDLYRIPEVAEVFKDLYTKYGRRRIVIVHAENPLMLNECYAGRRHICRPIESEISVLNLLKSYSTSWMHIHITHVTNALTLSLAKSYGFTVDTCPHYLYLDSNNEKEMGCIAKVDPPLRSPSTRLTLLNFVKTLDAITSDHAPHSEEEKLNDFGICPSGISSIDIMGSLVLNLFHKGVVSLDDVVNLLSKGPAKILGLYRWGCLYEGCVASYTVVDLDSELYVDPQHFYSKTKLTPYKTMRLRGSVKATIVRGYLVYRDNNIVEKPTATPITVFAR